MCKKIIMILIIFLNISFTYWNIGNDDYLKDSPKLCPIKYFTEENHLIYQFYDIYADDRIWICWTGFTHCKEENKWYIIYNNRDFTITTKWIYDIKYVLFNKYIIKTKMLEFNFYYFILFIILIYFYKKNRKLIKKTDK